MIITIITIFAIIEYFMLPTESWYDFAIIAIRRTAESAYWLNYTNIYNTN